MTFQSPVMERVAASRRIALSSANAFSMWGKVFGDPVVATALLDRLLHHAVVVHIEGASYRLRQHADQFPKACARHSTPTHSRPAAPAWTSPEKPNRSRNGVGNFQPALLGRFQPALTRPDSTYPEDALAGC